MNRLLVEGLSDALGFVVGGLLGFGLGQLLGWNLFAPGYGADAMGGILLVTLGCGGGLHLARHWRARRRRN